MSSPTGSSQWFANPSSGFYNGATSTSLRFDSGSSQFLSQTLGTTNRQKFTFSVWMKRTTLGAVQNIFSGGAGNSQNDYWFGFTAGDTLQFQNITGNSYNAQIVTTRLFRDTSAWYNFVLSVDSTIENSGTVIDRVRLYVNGVRETVTVNHQLQNDELTAVNLSGSHKIGVLSYGDPFQYLDGYLADANFVDGTSLEPAAFGELKNGVWIPRNPSPTYGTNGYRLQFTSTTHDAPANNGSADTDNIGADSSGENNHFTAADAIVASDCAMPDSPENNFCTLNRLANINSGSNHAAVHTEGNLKAIHSGASASHLYGTFRVNDFLTDGCYFEAKVTTIDTNRFAFGIIDPLSWTGVAVAFYENSQKAVMNQDNSVYSNDNVGGYVTFTPDTATTIGANDVFGVAVKGDDVWFHVNGVYTRNASDALGNPSNGANPAITAITDIAGTDYFPYFGYASDYIVNFGQDPSFAATQTAGTETPDEGAGVFKYAVPTGFKAMCSVNMPEPTIGPNSSTNSTDHFNAVAHTSVNEAASINVGFKPDWIWAKARNRNSAHLLVDSNRGVRKYIASHSVDIEIDSNDENSVDILAFTSTGFNVPDDPHGYFNYHNGSSTLDDNIFWNWKANGGTATATISESGNNPAAVVQANQTAGFSAIIYTGTGALGTIAHGLGAVPKMMIIKNRDVNDAWAVYHGENTLAPATDYLVLNDDAATADAATYWNDTAPTSSVFTVNTAHNVNADGEKYIAYVFAEVDGYSKFARYVTNAGNSGPFVHTGFRPAFVMVKVTGGGSNASYWSWTIYDNKRVPFNTNHSPLFANLAVIENFRGDGSTNSGGNTLYFDFLSNGFRVMNGGTEANGTAGSPVVYMAFAEMPFKYANAK